MSSYPTVEVRVTPQGTQNLFQRRERVAGPLHPLSVIFSKKFKSVPAFPMPALFTLSAVGISTGYNSNQVIFCKPSYWVGEDSRMTVLWKAVPLHVSSCLKLFP